MHERQLIQVNITRYKDENGVARTVSYMDFPDGCFEWKKASDVIPLPFDLVLLQTEDKIFPGWWASTNWFARKLKENDEVICWKRLKGREIDPVKW